MSSMNSIRYKSGVENIIKIKNMLNELKELKGLPRFTRCLRSTFSNAISEAINQVEHCDTILERILPFNRQSNIKKEKIVSGFIRESIREIRGETMNIKAIQLSVFQIMDVTKKSVNEVFQVMSAGDVCFVRLCEQPLLEFRCTFLGSQQDENGEVLYKFHVYYSINEINKKMKKCSNVQRYYSNEIAVIKLNKR